MRAKFDQSFCDYLLRIGDGTKTTIIDDKIKLPPFMIIPYKDEFTSLSTLILAIFPNIERYSNSVDLMIDRAILTPKNDDVDEINRILIDKLPGPITRYYSFDKTIDCCQQEDFLNSLAPNGLPPHELVLKLNCPIILLRNIDPTKGLCNGTRLTCYAFQPNVIDAEIDVGDHGKRVFIPRIPLKPYENAKFPFPFKRTQFPIRLSFAMAINKAQGQTLNFVSIYLPQSVFAHGQL